MTVNTSVNLEIDVEARDVDIIRCPMPELNVGVQLAKRPGLSFGPRLPRHCRVRGVLRVS